MILCVSSFISRPSEIRFAVTIVNFTLYHLQELQGRQGKNLTGQAFCAADPVETGYAFLRAGLTRQKPSSLSDFRISAFFFVRILASAGFGKRP
jgi:hypothetical protein